MFIVFLCLLSWVCTNLTVQILYPNCIPAIIKSAFLFPFYRFSSSNEHEQASNHLPVTEKASFIIIYCSFSPYISILYFQIEDVYIYNKNKKTRRSHNPSSVSARCDSILLTRNHQFENWVAFMFSIFVETRRLSILTKFNCKLTSQHDTRLLKPIHLRR